MADGMTYEELTKNAVDPGIEIGYNISVPKEKLPNDLEYGRTGDERKHSGVCCAGYYCICDYTLGLKGMVK